MIAPAPRLNGHVHAVAHAPQSFPGWAVCACGATHYLANPLAPLDRWHTCANCTPQFYGKRPHAAPTLTED